MGMTMEDGVVVLWDVPGVCPCRARVPSDGNGQVLVWLFDVGERTVRDSLECNLTISFRHGSGTPRAKPQIDSSF